MQEVAMAMAVALDIHREDLGDDLP